MKETLKELFLIFGMGKMSSWERFESVVGILLLSVSMTTFCLVMPWWCYIVSLTGVVGSALLLKHQPWDIDEDDAVA